MNSVCFYFYFPMLSVVLPMTLQVFPFTDEEAEPREVEWPAECQCVVELGSGSGLTGAWQANNSSCML